MKMPEIEIILVLDKVISFITQSKNAVPINWSSKNVYVTIKIPKAAKMCFTS